MRTIYIISAVLSLLMDSAFAENSVVIDQVGPGSVDVRQSGEENSLTVHQWPKDGSPDTTTQGTPEDYQKKILNNPDTSPLARTDAGKTPEEKKSTNAIHVQQTGNNNKSSTSQNGAGNDLTLEQNGANNQYDRTQTGDDNHTRVIQNGDVVEDRKDQ